MATFKKIRSVTQTVLKLENGQPRYLFVLAPMYQGEKLEADKAAAILLPVVDMESGEVGIVIAPTILQLELVRNYGADYVGKGFEVRKTRDMAQKYNHIGLDEVAPPDDFLQPASPQMPAAAIKAAADIISAALAKKIGGLPEDAAPEAKVAARKR